MRTTPLEPVVHRPSELLRRGSHVLVFYLYQAVLFPNLHALGEIDRRVAYLASRPPDQITRLKLLKRQMYGRANLDLLRLRMLHRA